MHGMDRKYDGHVWCKVITTNTKNSFQLSSRKVRCLDHLQCLHDDCENFLHTGSCNEIFWCSECTHILIMVQMALSPFASSCACKFYHSPPLCVADCLGRIYYLMHKLPSIIRVVIHIEVHKHPMADGKCKEFVDKIKRLIAKEVNYTLDVKIFAISLGASKTFLVTHLLDDRGDGIVELLNDKQLE